jgi:hypothetical protein
MFLGDFPEDFATVTCMFTTHAASGAPVAPSTAFEAADVVIYKNGNAAQKATTNGVTMTSPFDTITGLHCVVIDTSNDTGDGGFWVAGAQYTLVLSPDETVDGVAVAKVIGTFTIGMAKAAAVAALNTDTYAEPGQGTPGATISLAAKIGYLYKAWRNKKTVTATEHSLFNDDAATVDHKSTLSDVAGTFTETEKTTGP